MEKLFLMNYAKYMGRKKHQNGDLPMLKKAASSLNAKCAGQSPGHTREHITRLEKIFRCG